jgi:transposase InsO family protein
MMVDFIDDNRMEYGVEPICNTLPIAPSTYYLHEARKTNPDLEPERTRRDKVLKVEIQQIRDDNRKVYGAKKVWEAFKKVGRFDVARGVVDGLIHHSDRGSQYLSFRYSERLTEAGIEPSVGSKGDSYDNAMAKTITGLYKAEVIHRRRSWQRIEQVELETLDWVDWYNNRRLMEPLGYISPAEYESRYYEQQEGSAVAAGLN